MQLIETIEARLIPLCEAGAKHTKQEIDWMRQVMGLMQKIMGSIAEEVSDEDLPGKAKATMIAAKEAIASGAMVDTELADAVTPVATTSGLPDGATLEGTPQIFAVHEADVAMDGLATWRANEFREGPVRIIKAGFNTSKSKFYTREALSNPTIWDGAKMYLNHDTPDEKKQRPERDLSRLLGIIREPYFDESTESAIGTAKITSPSWREFLKGADEVGELGAVGLSINADGSGRIAKQSDGRKFAVVESFVPYPKGRTPSVDFVTDAGAGGQLLTLRESYAKGADTEMLETITLKDLKESRSDLVEELRGEIKAAVYGDKEKLDAEQKVLIDAKEAAETELAALKADKVKADRDAALAGMVTGLPEPIQAFITKQAGAQTFETTEAMQEFVTECSEAHKQALATATGKGKVTGFGGGDSTVGTRVTASETNRTFGTPSKKKED